MTKQEFIESFVKIDLIDGSKEFGFYPFHLVAKDHSDGLAVNALALGGDVVACYTRVKHYVELGYKTIYLAVDFPSGGDVTNDFVALFCVENVGGLYSSELGAMPYSTVTGDVFEGIEEKDSTLLQEIHSQFKSIIGCN